MRWMHATTSTVCWLHRRQRWTWIVPWSASVIWRSKEALAAELHERWMHDQTLLAEPVFWKPSPEVGKSYVFSKGTTEDLMVFFDEGRVTISLGTLSPLLHISKGKPVGRDWRRSNFFTSPSLLCIAKSSCVVGGSTDGLKISDAKQGVSSWQPLHLVTNFSQLYTLSSLKPTPHIFFQFLEPITTFTLTV